MTIPRTALAALAALLLAASVAGVATAAPAPPPGTYLLAVPSTFRPLIKKVHRATKVPVLLPATLPVDVSPKRIFGSRVRVRRGYDLELGVGRSCHEATACFVASFIARPGAHRLRGASTALARGLRGRFTPLSCGASCSPPSIEWVERGVLYSIQARTVDSHDDRAALVRIANSAIRGGPR